MKRLILASCLCVLLFAGTANALPWEVYSIDGPQDPLFIDGYVDELGEPPTVFPPDELISSTWQETTQTAYFNGNDNTGIPNIEVTMTNLTSIYWHDVHYVADLETTITNFDGWIGNAPLGIPAGDAKEAFRIDWVTINRPLISKSMTVDTIFEPGRDLGIHHPGLRQHVRSHTGAVRQCRHSWYERR